MTRAARSRQSSLRLGTSFRSRDPDATFETARTLMPALGISRVTDTTRLDRLDVPVFASIRPRGRTLRVNAGKGVNAAEARVGALMEAIEYSVAERASEFGADEQSTIGELVARWQGAVLWIDLCPRLGIEVDLARPIGIAHCEDLASGKAVPVPAELVLVPAPDMQEPFHFGWSTNGLASGNSLDEATLHALFEVLERDALAMNKARDQSTPVAADSLPEPFAQWAHGWQRVGVELFVLEVPNAFGLPCFEAFLHEPASMDVNLTAGAGLHADARIALARAVCEAAQSRLSFIHGGRDDIVGFFAKYEARERAALGAAETQFVARLREQHRVRPFDELTLPAALGRSMDASSMLQQLLSRMASLGFKQVLRRRLDVDGGIVEAAGLHVVKVVVPRCENVANDARRMGARLLQRVLGHG